MLAIGNVNGGTVRAGYLESVLRAGFEFGCGYLHAQGLYVPELREEVARRFLDETEHEWLLFVDSDILFTPDNVRVLLESSDRADRPVVSGTYFADFRSGVKPVAWIDEPDSEHVDWRQGARVSSLVECGTVGAGFLLIHRGVLELLREKHGVCFEAERDVESGKVVGEDVLFCRRVRACGVPVFLNAGVTVGHEKTLALGPASAI